MSANSQAIQLVIPVGLATKSKKTTEVIALNVSVHLALTDTFILVNGNDERQVRAIVETVDETMSRHGTWLARREGFQERRWVLPDYGETVARIQHKPD